MRVHLDAVPSAANQTVSSLPDSICRAERRVVEWTVIVPFFNERLFLGSTLASLHRQSTPFRLILVDNGSTDGSGALARQLCETFCFDFELVTERRVGKVSALAAGLAQVRTRFVATCDADTTYPADYLQRAQALLGKPGTAAVTAHFPSRDRPVSRWITGIHIVAASRVLKNQCHTGGAGQAFLTSALRAVGGFDPCRWNWVLEDHEIMHQIAKRGDIRSALDFWCLPSPRLRDRPSIRWSLGERIAYHLCPAALRDRYFEQFLKPRLKARGLRSDRIRERAFHSTIMFDDAAPDPLRG